MKYRPDIDGLRAVAVLVVLLYHFKLGASGGFVGVDIFFVISGFLITKLILGELRAEKFSMLQFWERRVRRLLPALFTCLLVVGIVGYGLLLPSHFRLLGFSIALQPFTNFVFWKLIKHGYFADSVEVYPSLHTWSLAVEEQFYFLYPTLLVWMHSLSWEKLRTRLGLLAIASFAVSVWGCVYRPDATFFLLPTRAWEFLVGAMLAESVQVRGRSALRESAGALGLLLILYCSCWYDDATIFPGIAAIAPCLGAGLVIFGCEQEGALQKVLSSRPMRAIGRISYSLYLWHWPLFAYSQYWSCAPLSLPARLGLLSASFLLGYVSFSYLEEPFRRRKVLAQRGKLFAAVLGFFALLVIAGTLTAVNQGLPGRWTPRALAYASASDDLADLSLFPRFSKAHQDLGLEVRKLGVPGARPRFVLWGDSHAQHLALLVHQLAMKYQIGGILFCRSATLPLTYHHLNPALLKIRGRGRVLSIQDRIVLGDFLLGIIDQHEIPAVIWAGQWSAAEEIQLNEGLRETYGELMRRNMKVYFVVDVPWLPINPPRFLALRSKFGWDFFGGNTGLSAADYEQQKACVRPFLDVTPKLELLDPSPYLVDSRSGVCLIESGGVSLYQDDDHLSVKGARRLQGLYEPVIDGLSRSTK